MASVTLDPFGIWLWQSNAPTKVTDLAMKGREQLMAEQTVAQLSAIKRIMKLCFHLDEVDETIDALVTLGVKPDLITQAMSSATNGYPQSGVGSGGRDIPGLGG